VGYIIEKKGKKTQKKSSSNNRLEKAIGPELCEKENVQKIRIFKNKWSPGPDSFSNFRRGYASLGKTPHKKKHEG